MKQTVRFFFIGAIICSLTNCAVVRRATPDQVQASQSYIDKGVLALRGGQLADAQAAFSMAQAIADTAAASDGLGCVSLMKGDIEDAEEYFIVAFEHDSTYSVALGHLALVSEIRNNRDEAKGLYERALSFQPEDFRSRNNYAALIVNDDRESARAELHRAQVTARHPVIIENIHRIEGLGAVGFGTVGSSTVGFGNVGFGSAGVGLGAGE